MRNAVTPPPVPGHRSSLIPREYPQCDLENIMDVIVNNCSAQIYVRCGSGNNKLIILPEAWEELRIMLSWGRKSPMNILEQKFVGMGHFLESGSNMIIIVNHFIQIHTTNRTHTSVSSLNDKPHNGPDAIDLLDYYRNEFLSHESELNTDAHGYPVDPFIDRFCPSEQVVEGHTHPSLGVFFSGTDYATGSARAAVRPICNFVCDPHAKTMLAATGKNFADTEVIVFTTKIPESTSLPNTRSDNTASPKSGTRFDTLASTASAALRDKACKGIVRYRSVYGGKIRLKIDLITPEET